MVAPPGIPHKFINSGEARSRHLDLHPSGRMNRDTIAAGRAPSSPLVIKREDLPHSEKVYQFEGEEFGGIPVSFIWTDMAQGAGTGLHHHPYAEVFVVQKGLVTFAVGNKIVELTAGQIVTAPACLPHRLVKAGTDSSSHLEIHPRARIITERIKEGAET